MHLPVCQASHSLVSGHLGNADYVQCNMVIFLAAAWAGPQEEEEPDVVDLVQAEDEARSQLLARVDSLQQAQQMWPHKPSRPGMQHHLASSGLSHPTPRRVAVDAASRRSPPAVAALGMNRGGGPPRGSIEEAGPGSWGQPPRIPSQPSNEGLNGLSDMQQQDWGYLQPQPRIVLRHDEAE